MNTASALGGAGAGQHPDEAAQRPDDADNTDGAGLVWI